MMKNSIIYKSLFIILASLMVLTTWGCKDENELGGASNTYATIFPAAPNLNLVYGVDTIEMTCNVMNHYGKVFNTDVKWTSMDESVVRFIDGSNKLVAVDGAQGKNALVRATLPNGKYVETMANVINLKASAITMFKYENDALIPMSELEYINKGTAIQVVLVPNPGEMTMQDQFKFENDNITLKKLKLNPATDEKKISVTPKGGVWYLLSCSKKGEQTLKISIGKQKSDTQKVPTYKEISQKFIVGSVVSKMGLNKTMDQYEGTSLMDINKNKTITFYLEISPLDNDETEKIFNEAKWSFEGTGALIRDKRYEIEGSFVKFLVDIESGSESGTLSIGCSVQDKKSRMTVKIVDFNNQPFNGLSISPSTLDEELYVGETKNIRILVDPMTSYPYLSKDFNITFSTPDIVSITENKGAYTIKGLKQGETDLIVSVKGKEARLHIVTKAAVKSVLIDNTTPNIVMEGDVVDWFVNVVMQGDDDPDYDRVVWSIISNDDNKVSLSSNKGRNVSITAPSIGNSEFVENTIKAEYRGKSSTRDITIVPLQKSQNIESDDIDYDAAYVSKSGNKIRVELDLKSSAKDSGKSVVTYIIEPHSSVSSIDGTYNSSNSDIYVMWNEVRGLTKITSDANINISKVDKKHYNIVATSSISVGANTISVNANVNNIIK